MFWNLIATVCYTHCQSDVPLYPKRILFPASLHTGYKLNSIAEGAKALRRKASIPITCAFYQTDIFFLCPLCELYTVCRTIG